MIPRRLFKFARPRPLSRLKPLSLRYQSNKGSRQDTDQPVFIQDHYVRSALWSIDVFRRWIKFSLVGVAFVGATAFAAFEGVHMWVERIELAGDEDEENRRFGWDQEAERWTGGEKGGTDPALGWKGRHAVRSAWIAQQWGIGPRLPVIKSGTARDRQPMTLNVEDPRLVYARDFLDIAITIVEERMASESSGVHPLTLPRLLAWNAALLERFGSPSSLLESRSNYERIWAASPGKGIGSARIATKLGDLNQRLGEGEEALAWWGRAIYLLQGEPRTQHPLAPSVPHSPPSSPLAQRTLASTLVSLSAYHATSGQLAQAQAVQDASLDLLRSISTPDSFASTSPPEALHFLYILHRSALISIHHAEVLSALHQPIQTSIQWLKDAAHSSERVILALSNQPPTSRHSPDSPPGDGALLPIYSKSRVLNKPATNLLQNARRSAAEAWNLLGILGENHGSDPKEVLYCYERARQHGSAGK